SDLTVSSATWSSLPAVHHFYVTRSCVQVPIHPTHAARFRCARRRGGPGDSGLRALDASPARGAQRPGSKAPRVRTGSRRGGGGLRAAAARGGTEGPGGQRVDGCPGIPVAGDEQGDAGDVEEAAQGARGRGQRHPASTPAGAPFGPE